MKKWKNPVLLAGNTDTCPDIKYVTGFKAPDPVIFLKKSRQNFLVVSQLEYSRAVRTARETQVFTPELLGLNKSDRRRQSGWALGIIRKNNIKSVRVPPTFPYALADRIKKAGITVHISKDPIFPERVFKTATEISFIKQSQRAAVIGMRFIIKLISDSQPDYAGILKLNGRFLTSEEIRRRARGVMLEHDCYCRDLIVACGEQSADPHEKGSGPLKAGEPVVIDIFPQHTDTGYWGDLTRTVVKGRASKKIRDMYHAVKAAQHAALQALRPGISGNKVHLAACREFDRRGFKTEMNDGKPIGFFHGTGHGVGLEIHENPSIGQTVGILKPGHIVTIEPGLYYPGAGGVRIEDTVVITTTGWRYLAPCEKRLEI